MKLSVSNIAWDPSDEPEITAALRELGVDGISIGTQRYQCHGLGRGLTARGSAAGLDGGKAGTA